MPRQIECSSCQKDMGSIANGSKLRKGLVYLCAPCNDSQQALIDRLTSPYLSEDVFGGNKGLFDDIFGDIFKGRK